MSMINDHISGYVFVSFISEAIPVAKALGTYVYAKEIGSNIAYKVFPGGRVEELGYRRQQRLESSESAQPITEE